MKYCFVSIIFFFFVAPIVSQELYPIFNNYTFKHGLASNATYFICKDSIGYIWIGTKYGISRFDGYEFKQFSGPANINKKQVFEIQEGNDGKVWFNTPYDGLFYIWQDSIFEYENNGLILQNRDSFRISTGFYVDSSETVYVELEHWGIMKIDSSGNEELIKPRLKCCANIVLERGDHILYGKGRRRDVQYIDSLRNLGLQAGVEIYKSGQYEILVPNIPETQYSRRASCIYEQNRKLIFTGFNLYDIIDDKLTRSKRYDKDVVEIFKTSEGQIVFCLHNGNGVRIYDDIESVFEGKYSQYLEGYSISGFTEDNNGGFWFSSLEQGVFYIPSAKIMIYGWKKFNTEKVNAIEIVDNSVYFTFQRSSFVHQLEVNGNEILPTKFPVDFKDNEIFDIEFESITNTLWVSHLEGFTCKRKESHELLRISPPNRNYLRFKDLEFTNDGKWLVGVGGRGFTVYDIVNQELVYYSVQDVLSEWSFQEVLLGSAGEIFTYNENGIYIFHDSKLSPELLAKTIGQDVALMGACMYGSDHISLLTDDGTLYFYNFKKKAVEWQFSPVTTSKIVGIYPGREDDLWLISNEGILIVKCQTDGFCSSQKLPLLMDFNIGEITCLDFIDNYAIIGTFDGLVLFDMPDYNIINQKPIIQSVKISGRNLSKKENINLYHKERLLIKYRTLNYNQNGNIWYRYMFQEGGDWTLTKATELDLQNLRSGDYSFKVQSQNLAGEWSESTGFTFSVIPAWWATWWFRSLVLLVAGGLSYSYYRDKTNILKREVKSQKRIQELEKEALQAQMNPHFIFNCLSAIQYLINSDQKKRANTYLVRFADLVRQTLNNSLNEKIRLEDEIKMLRNYLNLEQLRFEDRFNFTIDVAPSLVPHRILIPPMLIQPYVENAVIHGLADRSAEGHVNITFHKKDEFLIATITDNGIGLNQGKLESRKKNTTHKSVGMTVSRERLAVLNKSDQINSVEVHDLRSSGGKSNGTKVVVKIGLRQ